MNASIFRRLVWKEYRIERAFWISMAALAIFLDLLLLVSASFVHDPRWAAGGSQRLTWLFGFALAFPAFYALGCGATMFAVERETGTFEFQRMLPVTAARLFAGKLALAVASTLAMITLLWPATVALAGGRTPDYDAAIGLWALWGFAAVELLVWGVFFSLLSSQPLKATILAVASASLGVHLVTSFFVRSGYDYLALEPYTASLLPRAAIVVVVGLADVWLGCRWFRERVLPSETLAAVRSSGDHSADQAATRLDAWTMAGRTMGFGRLVWQAWRQSRSMIGLLSALMAVLLCWGLWSWRGRDLGGSFLLLLPLLALMGANVFLADQRREGFRFLAERGASSRAVWLSRQLVWMTAAGLWAIIVLLMFTSLLLLKFHQIKLPPDVLAVLLAIPACAAAAYAAGQLLSIVFLHRIMAWLFALVLAGLLSYWIGLMVAGGVPPAWSVAPIPLVLLLATWVRTPSWLRERNTLRSWLPTGLVLAVPAAALLAAVPCYRVYEIPAFDPGFSPQEYARPRTAEEEATLDLYRQAWQAYAPVPAERETGRPDRSAIGVPQAQEDSPKPLAADAAQVAELPGLPEEEKLPPGIAQWLAANEKSLALALEASRRKAFNRFDPLGRDPIFGHVDWFGNRIATSGRQLESEGRLDEALERYLAALRISVQLRERAGWLWDADWLERSVYDRLLVWSARPGQTPERVRAAIGQIEKATKELPSPTDVIKSRYFELRAMIDGDPEAMQDMNEEQIVHLTLWLRWVPGERARAHRLLNLLTAGEIYRLQGVERLVAEGKKVRRELYAPQEYRCPWEVRDFWLRRQFIWQRRWAAEEVLDVETRRRAAPLLLAIRAWRLEHGELPKTLDELVGPYLDRLPLDPYSAEPFRYFPEGLPLTIIPPDERDRIEPERHGIKPGTPIVWSAGLMVELEGPPEKRPDWARIYASRYATEWRRPTIELDVWQAGWAFPLP